MHVCPCSSPVTRVSVDIMGTSVSLQQSALAVQPGSSVSTELRIRNTGDVVDQFAFQPLGDAASWITVDPPTVRLFPASDQVVTVTIAPPRVAASKAGLASWAIKAIPAEDPGGAAVAEGTVDVAAFYEIGAELQPVTGRGRLAGRFELAVDNRGNMPVPVRLAATDTEQTLGFEFNPIQIDTQPGSAHFAKVKVLPAKRMWRGQPKNSPFQIVVEPQVRLDPESGADAPALAPIVVAGNFLQEAIIPKWLLKAVLVALAVLLALFILWKTLLKPSVESAAREIAIEEVSAVEEQVAELVPAVEEAAQQAEQAQDDAAKAGEDAAQAEEAAAEAGGGGGGGGGGGLGNVLNETSAPSNFRLEVTATPGTPGTTSGIANPENTTFALTDMILQNPGGDVGRIRVKLNGATILESAMENFRDLDFHFVSPYVVQPGEAISVEIDCAAEQIIAGDPCAAAISFAGFTTTITETPAEGG